ncbi:MAG: type I DNA topoisomerase [Candidatus Omnitrophica bacterium]|nr:type I DNA topoisomerase [Candidatus Omnitrophota bacterium]
MKKSLVIVESPTKAKTIGKILGKGYLITSCMGHIIDLPKTKLGVDIEQDFQPSFVVIAARKKILSGIKKEAAGKEEIYLATDPDREGEAIAWHIKGKLTKNKKFSRVIFHEITPEAIKEAFLNPREFDSNMIEAQLARRILDRIVGYFLSPLLWRKIGRGLSAGRVQSPALRLIVERERQIQKFIPQEYWEIEAELEKREEAGKGQESRSFVAKLQKIDNQKAQINNRQEADNLLEDIKKNPFRVSEVKCSEKKRRAPAPFITSTMQQEAFNKLKFTARRTMITAQQLYEGIEVGEKAPAGLITYMRTDSTHVATSALTELREYILRDFGKEYLPQSANVYKTRKFAQEAHEAIRPTSIRRTPEGLKEFLTKEQFKLYELIYKRFLGSQMTPARYRVVSVSVKADKYLFSASGSELLFPGFTIIYPQEEKKEKALPELENDEELNLLRLLPSQHFSKPPSRYSEATLIKTLEEEGIGRPSTYAPIIQTIVNRDYVRRIKGYFYATELGFKVCDLLVEYFPGIVDLAFTAQMEEELDKIEEGQFNRLKVLNDFYAPFKLNLEFAQENIKKEIVYSDEVCQDCGKPMVIKWGRRGRFLSCSEFPKCRNSKSISSGVKCPEAGCDGELVERRSRRGVFYGCSNFPRCRYTAKALASGLPEEKSQKAQTDN